MGVVFGASFTKSKTELVCEGEVVFVCVRTCACAYVCVCVLYLINSNIDRLLIIMTLI